MKARNAWTLQALLSCLIWNGILVALFYFIGHRVLQGLDAWVTPLMQPEVQGLSEDLRGSLASFKQFLEESMRYILPVTVVTGTTTTLILWLFLTIQGRILIRRATLEGTPASKAKSPPQAPKAEQPTAGGPLPAEPREPTVQPAIQILSTLQQEGRFIDFLQEDLNLYDDAQIGAAVRSIHQGCKKAMEEVIDLRPVMDESEGATVTIAPGFDARAIRLTGKVSGDPPFKGILRHRGWKAERVELPTPVAEREKNRLIAPAEVEIEG
ncbi:MAG: DUF2760 domain-containing protein [Syntrophobacteraceae bacterium]|nr:DUF2760 domain-containing protein [Syntrophobacteraceae bacterium]